MLPPIPVNILHDAYHRDDCFRGFPVDCLTEALVNLPPKEQRNMIGEFLYPLVEKLEPFFAAKITGMLLEIDQTQLIHLIESPEALKDKVNEAIDILGDWIPQQLQLQEQEANEFKASMLLAKL